MSLPKNKDPFWWTLFGAGGTISAFFIPVHVALMGIAIPLGLLEAPGYDRLLDLVQHPLSRFYLFIVITLSLFHWAHRFRYTLYDGLQLKHLEHYIVVLCYGSASVGTVITIILLVTI